MTSTHTFQGLESDSKPSSRVLKPPGGGSSSIFGNSEEAAPSSRPHKMTSNIFGSKPEADNVPKRSNPPGGKTSGIFQDPAPVQPAAQRQNPPGGKTSDIFGDAKLATSPKAHPNKPRDNISLKQPEVNNVTPVKAEQPPPPPPAPTPEPTPEVKIPVKTPVAKEEKVVVPEVDMSKHEPHLGPKPRSHNRVLNPPGGKSSITFY